MATRAAKATMDAEARKRMVAALDTLRNRFGLDLPPERPLVRDPEYVAIMERTDMASILESLVNATAPKSEPKPEPQPFAAAPGDYRPMSEPAVVNVGLENFTPRDSDHVVRPQWDTSADKAPTPPQAPREAPERSIPASDSFRRSPGRPRRSES